MKSMVISTVLVLASGAAISAGAAGASWGRAIEVPGLSRLNAGTLAEVGPVSCPAAGSCVAGGSYTSRSGFSEGFVVSQRHGRWGRAVKVPGLAALSPDGTSEVDALSCAAPGNCAATGTYSDRSGRTQGFVVSDRRGVWGKATAIPGLSVLNAGGIVFGLSVSCGALDDCAVAGAYDSKSDDTRAFVDSEHDSVWAPATQVPGIDALTAGRTPGIHGSSGVDSVSCAAAGDCAATGFYQSLLTHRVQGFAVSESDGVWGKAAEIPGLGHLNSGGFAGAVTVSCASPGNCAAGGTYGDRGTRAFVVAERHGAWGLATAVRGLLTLSRSEVAEINSVSCGAPGSCVAAGDAGRDQGFTVTERNGVWGKAIPIPGLAALNRGQQPGVETVSCASTGNCAVGGAYQDHPDGSQAFVATERYGVWARAIPVPGLRALNAGDSADLSSVSCAPDGYCAGGGGYRERSGHRQGFVVATRRNL